MSKIATEFHGVTAVAKANIYFEGRVVSHTILFPDNSKKTIGLIYPGKYYFGTAQGEQMQIVSGQCFVKIKDSSVKTSYSAGSTFEVPPQSGFDIEVTDGICEYICSFLP